MASPSISTKSITARRTERRGGWLRIAACVVAAGSTISSLAYTTVDALPRVTRLTIDEQTRLHDLGERASKVGMLAAFPVLTVTGVAGTSGVPTMGQFIWRIDPSTATTGGGRWDEGFFEWRVRIDGAVPTTRISCTDPVDGATTRYLDCDQHAAVCAYVAQDAGDHIAEVRFRNAYGLWSEWKACAAVTVTARSGAECYVDGARADDTGDGLSWATAKKTFGAAVTLLDTLGDGATLWVRDCACSTNTFVDTAKNVLIAKDPSAGSATVTISSNVSCVRGQTGTDGIVISGINFTGSGRAFNFATTSTTKNVSLYNCTFGTISDWSTAQTAATVQGYSHINCSETAAVTDQLHFSDNTDGFVAFGVSAPLGSTAENSYRFTGGGTSSATWFHSFQYCDIGVSNAKVPLRWYGTSHLAVHRCKLRGPISLGTNSPGDSSAGGSLWAFDGCVFMQRSGQGAAYEVTIYSGWSEGTIRNSYFNNMGTNFTPRADEAVDDYITGVNILNNTFKGVRGFLNASQSLTNDPVNIVVKNNLFIADGMATTDAFIRVKNLTTTTGWVFEGNRFDRASDANIILRDYGGVATLNWTQYAALGFVSGGSRGATTINTTTLEPDGGLTDGVVSYPMPHVSYNGVRYSRIAANYPAGAWLDPAAAETPYDTYSTPGTYSWVSPITGFVNVISTGGGGGGGGRGTNTPGVGAGGGGGGERASDVVAVTEGESYAVVVGAGGVVFTATDGGAGGDSSFTGDSTSVIAKGGLGGQGGSGGTPGVGYEGGAGGTGGTGATKHAGGAGGTGGSGTSVNLRGGGGGGESGGTNAAGHNGVNGGGPGGSGGEGGSGGDGGDGGAGGASDDAAGLAGEVGVSPGGGGGGGSWNGAANIAGGVGAGGEVIISWDVPVVDVEELTARDAVGAEFSPVGLSGVTIHLGTFTLNEAVQRIIRLYNTGDVTMILTTASQSITGDATFDGLDLPPATLEIETGEYGRWNAVNLDTSTVGTGFEFELTMPHDGAETPFVVTFTFDVEEIELTLRDSVGDDFDPVVLDGGSVSVGPFEQDAVETHTFRIVNTGGTTVTLDLDTLAITGSGVDADPGTGTVALATGEFHEVQITFTTSVPGTGLTAGLTVDHDQTGSPFTATFEFDVEESEEPEPEPGDVAESRIIRRSRINRISRV